MKFKIPGLRTVALEKNLKFSKSLLDENRKYKERAIMFDYFDHEADIGIIGVGKTLAEAFEEGAKALFNVMVDIKTVSPKHEIRVECSAANDEELFVEWLNKLLTESGLRMMVFSKFKVRIEGKKLFGTAFGEILNIRKHKIKTEVKAATYGMLSIEQKGGLLYVKCVVDV